MFVDIRRISESAKALDEVEKAQRLQPSELEQSDNQDIWEWYFNQRGGNCQ